MLPQIRHPHTCLWYMMSCIRTAYPTNLCADVDCWCLPMVPVVYTTTQLTHFSSPLYAGLVQDKLTPANTPDYNSPPLLPLPSFLLHPWPYTPTQVCGVCWPGSGQADACLWCHLALGQDRAAAGVPTAPGSNAGSTGGSLPAAAVQCAAGAA